MNVIYVLEGYRLYFGKHQTKNHTLMLFEDYQRAREEVENIRDHIHKNRSQVSVTEKMYSGQPAEDMLFELKLHKPMSVYTEVLKISTFLVFKS